VFSLLCERDYSDSCEPIFMKLGGQMGAGTNRLDLGIDLDPSLET